MERKTLGDTIAYYRKKKNLTQLELAEFIGVTDKAVSKWERDLSSPDVITISKLAEIFGISSGDLLSPNRENNRENERRMMNKDLIHLILQGVSLAMGVAATVLSFLGEIDMFSAVGLLGIGLMCLSLSVLSKK